MAPERASLTRPRTREAPVDTRENPISRSVRSGLIAKLDFSTGLAEGLTARVEPQPRVRGRVAVRT